MKAALGRFAGKRAIYRRALVQFITELAAMPEQLRAFVAAGEVESAARLLHTLRGLAATIGATELAVVAGECEKQLGAGSDPTAFAELVARACDAIAGASPGLSALSLVLEAEQKPGPPTATVLDREALRSALARLAELLRESDMAAVEVMGAVARDFGHAPDALLQPLEEATYALDFKRALGLCEALMVALIPSHCFQQ